jgi:protein-S-isoprenylcysteine O-methyltransferase Ste14
VRIAFDIALGAWVLSEWSVRLRSHLQRQGTRLDRNSMLVVVASASYTGLIVTFLGLGLALDNWVAALAVLAVLPTAGLVYRIHFEERALLDGLGEPYRRFAAGRPRLFPGVW